MSTPTTPDSDAAASANTSSQSPQPPHGLVRILFPLGHLVATPAALRLLGQLRIEPLTLIRRHVQGDWGDLCPEDVQSNNEALVHGFRLLSSYRLSQRAEGSPVTANAVTAGNDAAANADASHAAIVWIITEADRSVTTLLLPRDY